MKKGLQGVVDWIDSGSQFEGQKMAIKSKSGLQTLQYEKQVFRICLIVTREQEKLLVMGRMSQYCNSNSVVSNNAGKNWSYFIV